MILLLRVVAPAGTRVRVTGTMPAVAGVSVSVPRPQFDPAETCTSHGGSVACVQGEEACPMPPATWHFRVRKISGPAGRIRVDFVVGPERSR